ncbi:LysR family transcriptional regulator [Verticiella sediminum]|uniref:LysR family transcriptional regulator n=1 Tax=Verticiella sediminum TaxID=1247510 RepID=A0A556B097_9BURK|nr:LysR family transcriptional regulator [Verticiella sediminum]TSH98590.1 LysR family transcriptional regulator [Verticiella sediminum]
MELRQILYFVRVAEQRSFSRAAELLGVSQPSLSRQVQLLEAELGRHLLLRNGRGVEPTEAGLRLLGHGRALLGMAERAVADVRDMDGAAVGKVVLGLPPRVAQVITPTLVSTFRSRFPGAAITVAEGLSAQMREALLAGRLELALLYDPAPSPQLAVESLFREPLVLAASPALAPRLPRQVPVARLGRYPLVVPSLPNAIRTLLERTCRRHGVQLNVVAEVDAVGTIQELAERAQAYAVLPRSAVAGTPELRMARIVQPEILNDLVLASPAKRPGTRLAEETAQLLRELDLSAAFG